MARRRKNPKTAERRRKLRELHALTLGIRPTEPKFVPPKKPRRGRKTRLPEKSLRVAAKEGLTGKQISDLIRKQTEF